VSLSFDSFLSLRFSDFPSELDYLYLFELPSSRAGLIVLYYLVPA